MHRHIISMFICVFLFSGQAAAHDRKGWTREFGRSGPDGRVLTGVEFEGDLIVGGRFLRCGDTHTTSIARWDGRRWHALGDVNVWEVQALVEFQDRLWVAGVFYERDGTRSFGKVWDGRRWSAMPAPLSSVPRQMIVWRNSLYVTGSGIETSEGKVESIVQLSDDQWVSVGGGLGREVYSVETHALEVFDGDLIVGGRFDTAGGEPALALAAWNGDRWKPLGNPPLAQVRPPGAVVSDLQSFRGKLYVSGVFTIPGHERIFSAVLVDGEWQPLNPLSTNDPTSVHGLREFEVIGRRLYAIGTEHSTVDRTAHRTDHLWRLGRRGWKELEVAWRQDDQVELTCRLGRSLVVGGLLGAGTSAEGQNLFLLDGRSWHGFREKRGRESGAAREAKFVAVEGRDVIIGAPLIAPPRAATSSWYRLRKGRILEAPEENTEWIEGTATIAGALYARGVRRRASGDSAEVFRWNRDHFEPLGDDAWDDHPTKIHRLFEFQGRLAVLASADGGTWPIAHVHAWRDGRWRVISPPVRLRTVQATSTGEKIILFGADRNVGGQWVGSDASYLSFDGAEWSEHGEGRTLHLAAPVRYETGFLLWGNFLDPSGGDSQGWQKRLLLIDSRGRRVDLPMPPLDSPTSRVGLLGMHGKAFLAWVAHLEQEGNPLAEVIDILALDREGWRTVGTLTAEPESSPVINGFHSTGDEFYVAGAFSGTSTADSYRVAHFRGRLESSPSLREWFDEEDDDRGDDGASDLDPGLEVAVRVVSVGAGLVRFQLAESVTSLRSAAIFDLRGRRVRDLSGVDPGAGSRTFDWTMKDDRGQRVSRGVYVLRVQVDGRPATARVVVE